MKKHIYLLVVSLLVLSVFSIGCQTNEDNKTIEDIGKSTNQSTHNEEEIKAAVGNLLIAAGNYKIEAMDGMISDKAMIGISSLNME
jgi:hypothetical protein